MAKLESESEIYFSSGIQGLIVGENKPKKDERGYFRRLFDLHQLNSFLSKENLDCFNIVQSNTSFNANSGTWRGLHMQRQPFEERKFVSVTKGSILDVIVDMRETSKTFMMHEIIEVSEENGRFVIVPKGCAHGYLTIESNSQVTYFVDTEYKIDYEVGFNILDPRLNIFLPSDIKQISTKDKTWPLIQ